MIDIICFKNDYFDLGFSKIYNFNELNVKIAEKDSRNFFEDKKVDIIVGLENVHKDDNLHYRSSGLNQVTAKLANKNGIAIGFSFNNVLNSNDISKTLGRMMLNVRLCRKYKVKMMVGSFATNKYEMRQAKDLLSFAAILGMSNKEIKEALNFKKKEKQIEIIK